MDSITVLCRRLVFVLELAVLSVPGPASPEPGRNRHHQARTAVLVADQGGFCPSLGRVDVSQRQLGLPQSSFQPPVLLDRSLEHLQRLVSLRVQPG